MSDDYLWDRSGRPDPEIKKLEQLLAPLAHDAPFDQLRARRRRPWILIGVAMAAAAGVAIWLAIGSRDPVPATVACAPTGSGFRFVARGGAVSCGDRQIAAGVLPVGGVLDTGSHEAELTIAEIGKAQLGANTRVSLDRSDQGGHHLSIDHGHMHARVNAPPRLFAVSTRSTEVTDLGCEYTIDVDDKGAGSLHVLSGKVELATKRGSIVVAPAGTHTKILAGQTPGLPIVDGASPAVEAAVEGYLSDPSALATLLDAASASDAITLVDLAVIDVANRRAVLIRLGALVAPPTGITVETALANPDHLAQWREAVMIVHFTTHSSPSKKPSKSAP